MVCARVEAPITATARGFMMLSKMPMESSQFVMGERAFAARNDERECSDFRDADKAKRTVLSDERCVSEENPGAKAEL